MVLYSVQDPKIFGRALVQGVTTPRSHRNDGQESGHCLGAKFTALTCPGIGGVAALRGVGVQAVVTEYLIRNCHNIFDALDDHPARHSMVASATAAAANAAGGELRLESLTDCESLLVEQREQDQSLGVVERPKSLSTGGAKLISLEEAQERHSRVEGLTSSSRCPLAC